MTTPPPDGAASPTDDSSPQALARALRTPGGEPPRPGELWRLEFEGVALVVAIVEAAASGHELAVVPVGEDPGLADGATVRLGAGSGLGFAVGVWLACERWVPSVVAEARLGVIDPHDWGRVQATRTALRGGGLLGDGPAITSMLDPRVDYRAALEAPLRELADAAWVVLDESERADHSPAGLVLRLHAPQRRRQLLASGRRHGNAPVVERRVAQRQVLATVDPLARAAPDWDAVLDRWFAGR